MDLAEGRMEPNEWIAWWTNQAANVEAACPRGWFLKLKPRHVDSSVNRATLISQNGACSILEALHLPFVRSDRYEQAWNEEFQQFCAAEKARNEFLAKQIEPRLSAFSADFPKFARFLKKRASEIDHIEEPASESEIVALEDALGVPLPMAYRQFLKCSRALSLDGLSFGLERTFRHPAILSEQQFATETICIAEYWLEADGDQVLVEYRSQPADNPPVFYYAHSAATNIVRKLAPSFSAWIESLSTSKMFRE